MPDINTPLAEKLILGTVQFGLDYGINNPNGQLSREEAFQILDRCYAGGVRCLDTAAVYGNSEAVLGAHYAANPDADFKVITKLDKKEGVEAKQSVSASLQNLNRATLEGVLFHSYAHYNASASDLDQLRQLKAEGIIRQIGVSVYTNDEIEALLGHDDIDVLQLPFNLLDNARLRKGILTRARKSGKQIHARSVFLQGLFFKETATLSEKLQPLTPYLENLQQIADKAGMTMHEMALCYAVSRDYIDAVLIGVDSVQQLEANLMALNADLTDEVLGMIEEIRVENQELLFPFNW